MAVPDDTAAQVRALCSQTLSENWREGTREQDGTPFGYTRPSPGHYPFQWYWDSCFAAAGWRRFDDSRARIELESLLAAANPDGFIGHTIFWDTPLNRRQALTYNVVSRHDLMTSTIQPPLLAWAWRIAVGDPREQPRILQHHQWLRENRGLDGDGLLWIIQPDESGLDASPQFDVIWGHEGDSRLGFPLLVHRNRGLDYKLTRVVADGHPVCLEVMTNVFWGLSCLAAGQPSITDVLIARCYDEHSGLFKPLARPMPVEPPTDTWAALSPLALPDLPEPIGRRLVEQYLLDPEQYWLPVAPPSVPANAPSFSRRASTLGIHHYWRGPTWINAAWLVWLGLRRLGYSDQAQSLADGIVTTVASSGLREYYDPYNGKGMGAKSFAWSTLVLELLDPDPRATTSYLEP